MPSFFRRMFGTESIGDIPTRHLAVLLYLDTTKRKKRLESALRIADALGLGSENTVVKAYGVLYSRGYISIAKDAPRPAELPGRDARILEVTRSGKRALRPFFNVVGITGLVGFVAVSLVVGALLGYAYAGVFPYFAQYPTATVAVFSFAAIVYAILIHWVWRIARDFRREQLFKMFRADTKPAD